MTNEKARCTVILLQKLYRTVQVVSHAAKGRSSKLAFAAAKPGKVKTQHSEATLREHPTEAVTGDGLFAAGETVAINDESYSVLFLVMCWQVETRIQL